MGTSKGYGGPASGLVPSWVDDVSPPAVPAEPANDPLSVSPEPTAQPPSNPRHDQPPIDNSGTSALSGARGNFTRFARTGSQSSLGRALSTYVRKGTGGASRAARRMGASRVAAGRLLGVIRDVQQLGAAEVLRQLNLAGLAGQPASNVFLAMLEFVCPAGGAIDEAVARQAMLENIGELAATSDGSFEDMTSEQMNDFFLDFVGQSIEGMVMADLGGRGITLPDDVAAVERMQRQLHSFITGSTRGRLSDRLEGLPRLTDQEVNQVVSRIYEAAFELIAAAGESAE